MVDTMKVLHILGELHPSGMERMLVSGFSYLSALGCRTIVVGQGESHPFKGELQKAGYDVKILESTLRTRHGRSQLRNLIRAENVDVVHIHTEGNYLMTVLTVARALRRNGRIIRTIHSIFAPRGRRFATRLVQAAIADRFVRQLIAPSPDVAENERRFLRSPRVIYNWVDDRFADLAKQRRDQKTFANPQSRPVALIVGNCSPIKRHELAEIAILSAGHELIHIGSELNADAKEADLLSRLESRGLLSMRGAQSPDLAFVKADYFVMSSTKEGMGVALAEAIVMRIPCYITDVAGLRWAASSPGVTILPEDQNMWNRALANYHPHTDHPAAPDSIDFTALRGAKEYFAAYTNG
jgi:hypothetical protein